MMKPPKEKAAPRVNVEPARPITNYTQKLIKSPARSKAKQPLYVLAVDLADAILNAILFAILKAAGAVAKWSKGGSR